LGTGIQAAAALTWHAGFEIWKEISFYRNLSSIGEKMAHFTKEATENNFQADVLNSDKPVLVDFWAEWCGPCRMIAPALEELAEKYQGKASVYKMNVDENPITPNNFGVRAIPTLIVFKGGQEQERVVGVVSLDGLSKLMDKYV
jgi:thioredoxin 1